MHTQAGHVLAMNEMGVGWILDLKGNQPGLYALADAHPWGGEPVLHATAEVGHGRPEIRTIRVTSQPPGDITRRFPRTPPPIPTTPSPPPPPRTPATPPSP